MPAWPDRFVGRESELAELTGRLPKAGLLTVVGAPGAGKSRLAAELVSSVRGSFRGGAQVIELVSAGDRCAVPRFGAGTRALLVLDNCEHLVRPCRSLVATLLREHPRLVVLATSREPLGVVGEDVYRLGGLTDAVRLFAIRARASDLSFELSPATTSWVEEICARVGGLPLAIELLARTVRLFPVAEIAARLGDGLFDLATGARTADGRHLGLREAFEWSYDLLTADERAGLRRLALFDGEFDLGAATAVSGAAPHVVVSLAAKSLLEPSPPRFRMLEPIRCFARDLLDADEAAAARDRLEPDSISTPHRPARHLPTEVTPAETRVAELVARGLTNREIADRLGVSVRTVECRIRGLRVRLGLRSRVQLATWAAALRPDGRDT